MKSKQLLNLFNHTLIRILQNKLMFFAILFAQSKLCTAIYR